MCSCNVIWFVINELKLQKHWYGRFLIFQWKREKEKRLDWVKPMQYEKKEFLFSYWKLETTFIVFSNGIERCARLWADDNSWLSSCQIGEAKRGQKALSQLQTSAWCRRHQSATTDTSSERAGEKRQGDDGLSLCLSLPPPIPPFPCLLSSSSPDQLSVGVCWGTALCHTLTGESGRRGVDREIWI